MTYTPAVGHKPRVWRETRWPAQWIGMCSCGRGIRCNSRGDADWFLVREGCVGQVVSEGTPAE